MSTLHVYLDESGNFTFSPKGSKYYTFAAVWTYEPPPLAAELTRLRFKILKQGFDLQAFHAAVDKQWCRNLVVQSLSIEPEWRFGAVVVEKAKVNPAIREPHRFYPQFMSSLLRFIFRGSIVESASGLMIFTDTLPIKNKRKAVEKTIRETCIAESPSRPFQIFHHCEESNAWIQAADYCSWAVHRKWERGDVRTYDQIKHHLHSPERDVLSAGATFYY